MTLVKNILLKLEGYTLKGSFNFRETDILSKVCNIPKKNDYSGIYLFYSQANELIYVGISGREGLNGNIIHRKDGLRGRLLNGKQFGGKRSKTLPIQMAIDGISSLQIRWFVTYGEGSSDMPRKIEKNIIEAYKNINNGLRPKWNKKD